MFRSREPAIKIEGSEPLRHPVDILLLELMKAYIFLITLALGTLLKSLGLYSRSYYILSFGSREPRSREPAIKIDGSETLIITLTYVLMENFCPCFITFYVSCCNYFLSFPYDYLLIFLFLLLISKI